MSAANTPSTRSADRFRRGEPLEVQPLHGPLDAVVRLPGSKSITNRALLVAALADGPSVLSGVLDAEDTAAMLDCLFRLGVQLTTSGDTVTVEGCGGRWPATEATLDARQAGTVGRFLPAALALGQGRYRLDGAAQLRERPLGPLVEALRQLGGEVHELGAPGCLPIEVVGHGAADLGGEVALAADVSSQFVSGLMLAGPLLAGGLRIRLTSDVVSRPYLTMTAAVMAAFGGRATVGADQILVESGRYRGRDYRIEPDASAASYVFAAAAVCGGRVVVPGLGRGSLQGDTGFAAMLGSMGAEVDIGEDRIEVRSPSDGVLRGVEADLGDLSDTAPTLAAVAPFAQGRTRATGIGFIRRKESDRIGAVLGELAKLGVAGEAEPDGWVIRSGAPHGGIVATHDDHRLAMSFAVIGLATPGVVIEHPECVAKTFPGYWAMLDELRATVPDQLRVVAVDGPAGTGKSTVSRGLAARLGLCYLDTGAMYRAVTWAALDRGVDPGDAVAVAALADGVRIVVGERTTVDGVDCTEAIRTAEVTRAVSVVAANSAVRATLVARQRAWLASNLGGVVEGRDIGTVVVPGAPLKIYLTASAETRAQRRAGESGESVHEVAEAIRRRDEIDSTRADSPLAAAGDAVVVDSTGRTAVEVIDLLESLAAEALPAPSSGQQVGSAGDE